MKNFIILSIVAVMILLSGCARKIETEPGRIVYVDDDFETEADSDGSEYAPYHSLQEAIDSAWSGDRIFLMPGIYSAEADEYVDSLCGNCLEHRTLAHATVGFHIKDKQLTIEGFERDSVRLLTNAGYGVLFENCPLSRISNLTISGGKRDLDGNATDAAVVVKFSDVTVENCTIIDNEHKLDTVVVGIGGVFGREGAQIIVRNNLIKNNSWDAIALYRGASAFIADNEIDKGRGVGIGITWDAHAVVTRNLISNYWKGIGTFGNSSAVVTNNIVFDNLGWGIIATGNSFMEARNNNIVRNGNCGFAAWSDSARGVVINNIIADNGWREKWVCPCVGVWMNGDPENFRIEYNDVWGNDSTEYRDIEDLTGQFGNLSVDPMFVDSLDFHLRDNSPLYNAGHPYYTNPDGGRSDIGAYGGLGGIK